MIPLAQYLSDMQDDEFVPFRPVERRPPPPLARDLRSDAPTVRTLKPFAPAPAPRPAAPVASLLKSVPVETVPLDELRAARAAWAGEKQLLAEAAEQAREEAVAARETELRAEIEAQAEASVDAVRADLEVRYADAIAAERERWTSEQADRLADLMILQMAVFEDTMRATVRGVLRPLATQARQRQALDDLADAVNVMSPEGAGFKIAATGPSDLLAKFRDKLGDKASRVVVKPDEDALDIRVEADATSIETRMGAWGLALEKALS